MQPPIVTDHARPVVTLTSDFGLLDPYVAIMKGVMLQRCENARFVDITHQVPPGDLHAGAFAVEEAMRWFPVGTVHLAVVDPGVGTGRMAVAASAGGHLFVGPDNGLLWPVLRHDPEAKVYCLENPEWRVHPVSATFHGRDVFAPAAAALASGAPLEHAGPEHLDPVRLLDYDAARDDAGVSGTILKVDRFGNLVTTVTMEDVNGAFGEIPLEGLEVAIGDNVVAAHAETYGHMEPDVPFVLEGSSGRLEIALSGGSAARVLGVTSGEPLSVRRRTGS
ncbi:MAG: SAM hydrolase/SAM-dependent halogenase family protein [Planctomycetota bacterium]|jgi:S-adenosylmethionine hydrolase